MSFHVHVSACTSGRMLGYGEHHHLHQQRRHRNLKVRFRIEKRFSSCTFPTRADAQRFGEWVDRHGPARALEMIGQPTQPRRIASGPTVSQAVADYISTRPGIGASTGAQYQCNTWMDAPKLAAELDQWLSVLAAAAWLAGGPDPGTETEIPLVVSNFGKLHRRQLWAAWHATRARGGRWSALVRLGAHLNAAGNPQRVQPVSEPPPLKTVWIAHPGGHRPQTFDPLDGPVPAGLSTGDAEWST